MVKVVTKNEMVDSAAMSLKDERVGARMVDKCIVLANPLVILEINRLTRD